MHRVAISGTQNGCNSSNWKIQQTQEAANKFQGGHVGREGRSCTGSRTDLRWPHRIRDAPACRSHPGSTLPDLGRQTFKTGEVV